MHSQIYIWFFFDSKIWELVQIHRARLRKLTNKQMGQGGKIIIHLDKKLSLVKAMILNGFQGFRHNEDFETLF